LVTTVVFNSHDGGVPTGRSRKIFRECQRTKCHRNIAENYNRLSRVNERYRRHTYDRQMDGRQQSLKTKTNAFDYVSF